MLADIFFKDTDYHWHMVILHNMPVSKFSASSHSLSRTYDNSPSCSLRIIFSAFFDRGLIVHLKGFGSLLVYNKCVLESGLENKIEPNYPRMPFNVGFDGPTLIINILGYVEHREHRGSYEEEQGKGYMTTWAGSG